MTIGVCLTVPLFNVVANKHITGERQDWRVLQDMIPVFIAIGIVYTSSPLLMAILILTGFWTVWKYYLIHLNNRAVWKQVLGTGRRAG